VKLIMPTIWAINAFEPEMENLSAEEMKAKTQELEGGTGRQDRHVTGGQRPGIQEGAAGRVE